MWQWLSLGVNLVINYITPWKLSNCDWHIFTKRTRRIGCFFSYKNPTSFTCFLEQPCLHFNLLQYLQVAGLRHTSAPCPTTTEAKVRVGNVRVPFVTHAPTAVKPEVAELHSRTHSKKKKQNFLTGFVPLFEILTWKLQLRGGRGGVPVLL